MPPRLARLLAIVAAVLLVVAAFALRGALGDDDTTADGSSGDPADPSDPDSDAPFRVLCDDDLGTACDELEGLDRVGSVEVVRGEDAMDRLAAADAPYDAWLTLDPWPDVAAYLRDPAAYVADPEAAAPRVVPVASAPLAVLADPATSDCAATPTWGCLAGDARPPVGLPSLSTSLGPLVLGHAAAGLLDRTDFGLAATEDVRDALVALVEEAGRPADDLVGQIVLPGNHSAVVATQGRAEAIATSAQGRTLDLVAAALTPKGTVGVVLAGVGPRGPAALDALRAVVTGQTVATALRAEGWNGPAARSSGLPDPDVIYALKEELA
jgi:hypothetical protein